MEQEPDAHEQLKAEILKDVEEKLAAGEEADVPSASSSDQTADDGFQDLEAEVRKKVEAEIENKCQEIQPSADGNDKTRNLPKPMDNEDAKTVNKDELKPGDKSDEEAAEKDAKVGEKSDGEAAEKTTAKGKKRKIGNASAAVARGAGKGDKSAGKKNVSGAARGKKKPAVNAMLAKQLKAATGNKKHSARLLEEKQMIDSHFRKRQMVIYVMITTITIVAAIVIFLVARNRDNSAPGEPRNENRTFASVGQTAPPQDDQGQAMEPSPALRVLMGEAKEFVALGKFKESIKLFQDHIYDDPLDKLLCEQEIKELIAERDHVDRGSLRWQKVHAQARELILQASNTKDAEKIIQALSIVRTFNRRSGNDRDRAEELLRKLGRIHFNMTGRMPPDLRRSSDPGAGVPQEPADEGAVDTLDLSPRPAGDVDW